MSLDDSFDSELPNDTDEDARMFTKKPPQTIPTNTKQSAMLKNTKIPLDMTNAACLHDATSMKVNSESVNNTGVDTTMEEVAYCKKQLPIENDNNN